MINLFCRKIENGVTYKNNEYNLNKFNKLQNILKRN